MAYSKEQLLSLLQELQISFSKYEHPVVMTVEAQAKYVGHLQGALSKNLFLKDKKQRFYIVSAMTDTKVDLKVLSQRLGLGKGGLRMAPEEALQEILQVPLGSVTPFSLVNESSRHVSLLLDQGFRTQECCFFHPLSNDMTISLNTKDLDKFLKSIGREPSYVDLEANPSVGKDQPPDLAELIPSGTRVLPDPLEKVTPTPAPNKDRVSVDSTSLTNTGKSTKPSGNVQNVKDNKASATRPPSSFADTERFVEEILKRTSSLVMKEVTDEAIKQHGGQLGDVVAETIKKRLSTDLNNLAMIFKNTAYTEGFHANTRDQHRRL